MFRFIGCFILCCGFSLVAQAQVEPPYNPYADPSGNAPPIAADGSLNWPSFFKSAGKEAKYQMLFAIGNCKGTSKPIVDDMKQNKVNVNALQEATISGRCVSIAPGTCTLLEASGLGITLMTHPAGVSKINVVGTMPIAGLAAGMTVRFEGKVNGKNLGVEPLGELEVLTPNADLKIPSVVTDRQQIIVGNVIKYEEKRRRLTVAPDKTHRYIFVLAENAKVDVNAHTLNLIFVGDEVTAKGRAYSGEGSATQVTLFASQIDAKKISGAQANAPVALTVSE